MKKYILIIILSIILISIVAYIIFSNKNNNNQNTDAIRINTQISDDFSSSNQENANTEFKIISATQGLEEEISKFSTKISYEDSNRDTNMKITASKINGTIIPNGKTFSFNEIAGNPTSDEGYKKSGVIVDGKKVKGYGGGNCQVSTTIYNAAAKIDGIKITEKHEHGIDVGYIKMGKDATVAYGDLDLKFKNNTGYPIKLYVEITDKKVICKIVKISI